jgi:hypothetical protein
MQTIVQKIESNNLFAGTFYGTPIERSSNAIGEYSVYEENEVILYFIDRGEKYNAYLFKTSSTGMEKIPGVSTSVKILIHIGSRHKIKRLKSYVDDLKKKGLNLNELPDGFFYRMNALLEEKENNISYNKLLKRYIKT